MISLVAKTCKDYVFCSIKNDFQSSIKGVDVANTVIACLEDWNITNNMQTMYFDSTSSNAGNK